VVDSCPQVVGSRYTKVSDTVRISVFWVLSKLVKLLMQSFHHVLYINYHQPMQYDLHCIPEILTDTLITPEGCDVTSIV
jgi:hypothetical protein